MRFIVWDISISFLELIICVLLGELSSAETVINSSLATSLWPWYLLECDVDELIAQDQTEDMVTDFGWKAEERGFECIALVTMIISLLT